MSTLFAEFARFLSSRDPSHAANFATFPAQQCTTTAPDTNSWALPNDRRELPPPAICNLCAADSSPPSYRVRGGFVPAAVHCLAARRLYAHLLSSEGGFSTPMPFVLHMRLLDALRFSDAAPILVAPYSAQLGRCGITTMHYLRADRSAQLRAGSSDANYSANVVPPSRHTYHDLLCAIHGLLRLATSSDPHRSQARVQRTHYKVNQFLGLAFICLASDSPAWWRDFCAAMRRIQFTSAS
ncbi:hypothetical protein PC129_g4573 [Phytophthora cactorum]|nr:hypothetical protein Pcac1_g10079 [Phytophthora cactorum]KAG2806665.1 hypothetical protein PC111_g17262 [Phytophthora cactorum]KAG2836939.1 hypothetical protein PC112_g5088 [Phytophthora cactorum]KAG2864298.1 hypothetical protein PC113_g4710 [Phytophthora cactorum]KAG2922852.1 hypothetical protein PC114_g5057 [Phytophthora cactorum]